MAANLLHLLLLSLSSLSLFFVLVSAEVFVSINCGTSSSYSDENFILWFGDNFYVQNGENHVVQTPSSVSHVLSTLRVFTTHKKNCYTIDIDKGDRVLVRAGFFYGNYDKKSSPPTFNLQFDGNHWATVVTSSDDVVYYEAVYSAKWNTISVCVAQTQNNQFPFISTLEVRSLDIGMYSHVDSNYPLFLRKRVAFGTNKTIRFSNDAYDRIWVPAIITNRLVKVPSDLLFMKVDVEDNPPRSVLQSAMTPKNVSFSFILNTNLPKVEVPIYINTYFSELAQLDSMEKRSFQIYINNEASTNPIIPPYGSTLEIYIGNMTASANTLFSLVATSDSTLPPLINAMEVFSVGDALTDGTNAKDVDALTLLQNNFVELQEWSGDPCLPAPFTWDWVACSSDATPRITALYLSGLGLYGTIPDFSGMDALETMDFHNNSFIEEVPAFLGSFPNLVDLNLADNDFFGTIPSSLSQNKNLNLNITGNPDLCISNESYGTSSTRKLLSSETPPWTIVTSSDFSLETSTNYTRPSNNDKKSKKLIPTILRVVLAIFSIFWVIFGVLAILHHRQKITEIVAFSSGQIGEVTKPDGPPFATPTSYNTSVPGMNLQDPTVTGDSTMNDFRVVEIGHQIDPEPSDMHHKAH